jgi:hypothetical protein
LEALQSIPTVDEQLLDKLNDIINTVDIVKSVHLEKPLLTPISIVMHSGYYYLKAHDYLVKISCGVQIDNSFIIKNSLHTTNHTFLTLKS